MWTGPFFHNRVARPLAIPYLWLNPLAMKNLLILSFFVLLINTAEAQKSAFEPVGTGKKIS
jgi:hypothetical protein